MPRIATSLTLSAAAYNRLRDDLAAFIDTARQKAHKTAAHILVTAYWNVGKRIAREKLTSRAGYHNSILANLATDLSIDPRTLQNCVRFHQTYPKPPTAELSWAHYRELIRLRDAPERRYYEQLAAKNAWPVRRLTDAIKQDRFRPAPPPSSTDPERPAPKKLPRPLHDPYLYMATVHNVVDGDTLQLNVNLGFSITRLLRVRLAAVDAPPLDTPAGRKAHDFTLERLTNAHAIAVKTEKIDIYGRYVAHIFYTYKPLPKTQLLKKGRYLNQDLLDHAHAVPI